MEQHQGSLFVHDFMILVIIHQAPVDVFIIKAKPNLAAEETILSLNNFHELKIYLILEPDLNSCRNIPRGPK